MFKKVNLPHLVLTALALLFFSTPSIAKKPIDSTFQYHKNFTRIDGLPSTEIYDIAQDNEGYLWFATNRGLARYDGKKFQTFGIKDGLPDIVVFNFFEQADGNIWCSTLNKKLFYFKNATEGFHLYPYNAQIIKHSKKSRVINNIGISEEGTLYLSFVSHLGYTSFDKNGNILVNTSHPNRSPLDKSISVIETTPNFLFVDEQNSNYITNNKFPITQQEYKDAESYNNRYYSYASQKKSVFGIGNITLICDQEYNLLWKKKFDKRCIYIDRYDSTSFWIGFQYGVASQYDLEGNLITHFLPGESVTKIFFDHEGGQWFSTLNSGLFYNPAPAVKHYIFNSFPTELTTVNKDSLFIALDDGSILLKDSMQQFELFHKPSNNESGYVHFLKDSRMLLFNGGHNYIYLNGPNPNRGSFNMRNNFSNISDANEGTPMAVLGKHVYNITPPSLKKIPLKLDDKINDVAETEDALYIAANHGLYKFEDNIVSSVFPSNTLFRDRIYDIDYKFENLYMATFNEGLVILKPDTILSINQNNGLLSNRCMEVFIENEHTIWVGTDNGLSRVILYPNNKFDVQSLSIQNGLNCTEIIDIEIIEDEIWLTAKEGLFNFNKSFINQSTKDVKKWLSITEMKVNDSIISNSKMTFHYLNNNISFKFNSISLKNPAPATYRYRLLGLTKNWTQTSSNNVNFSHLSPGQYTFEIGLKRESGNWTEHVSTPFVIQFPFWRTSWFIIGLMLFLSLILFLTFRYRLLVFNPDSMIRGITKFRTLFTKKKAKNEVPPSSISIKSSGNTFKIATDAITYFKSSGNYVEIYTTENRFMIRGTLIDFYALLPNQTDFIQLHRSFYVQVQKVTKINSKAVYIDEIEIPVSRTYAKNLAAIQF